MNNIEEQFLKVMNALSEPTRLKIVYILQQGDFCPIHLEQMIGVSQTNISRHSQKLLAAQIIQGTKKGRRTIYSLTPTFKTDYFDLLAKIETMYRNQIDLSHLKQHQKECQEMS